MVFHRRYLDVAVLCMLAISMLSLPVLAANPQLTAVKVSQLPIIDGNAMDSEWEKAPVLKGTVAADQWPILVDTQFEMKAVYTDEELALLATFNDPLFKVNTSGAWSLMDGQWKQQKEIVKWESFKGERHPHWFAFIWNISMDGYEEKGCTYTCHDGSDNHHDLVTGDVYGDIWHILAKHGYGPEFYEAQGWLAGGESVEQSGSIQFSTDDPIDSHSITSGKFNFIGWAEDKLQAGAADTRFTASTPATAECNTCHGAGFGETHALKGDTGELPYFRNFNDQMTAPLYIKKNPVDWIDAMIITQSDIELGKAVKVADLSQSEPNAYWANYKRLNAVVPELVLKDPSGSQADVRVGATWDNGRWTIEIVRQLVTNSDFDVQFDDLSKQYPFSVSLWGTKSLIGDFTRTTPVLLGFAQ